MGVLADICRKYTGLSAVQFELLDKLSAVFPVAADLAHAHLLVYAASGDGKMLVIVAGEKPNTSFTQYNPGRLGARVRSAEEPLIWRTLTAGCPLKGKREWAWGYVQDMYTFPLRDLSGAVMAVVSFESNSEELRIEGYRYLLETAYALLTNAALPVDRTRYRRLSANDGILITDRRNKIVFANTAAVSIYKVLGVGDIVGHHMFDRQITRHIARETTLSQRPDEKELEAGNLALVQRAIPIEQDGRLLRTVLIVSDVTEVRKKEKELMIKSAVIQEIHHRVKNNLQTIASLLRLQSRRTQSAEVKAALRESINRILSISVVHEFLSQQDAERIDVVEVAKNILDLVIQNMLEPGFVLRTEFNGETIILPSEQASSLALVINELIQNSLEHGFSGCAEGLIGLDIVREEDSYVIDLYDNGAGMPENFDPRLSKSLGLQIARTLVEGELGGTFALYNDCGAHAKIRIPRAAKGGTYS